MGKFIQTDSKHLPKVLFNAGTGGALMPTKQTVKGVNGSFAESQDWADRFLCFSY